MLCIVHVLNACDLLLVKFCVFIIKLINCYHLFHNVIKTNMKMDKKYNCLYKDVVTKFMVENFNEKKTQLK